MVLLIVQGEGDAEAEAVTDGEATGEAVAEAPGEAVADAPGEAAGDDVGSAVVGSGVLAGDVRGCCLIESIGAS